MNLNANVVLAGKYIILSSLYDTENYIMYLAKAPSLGEEFVLTEFFPKDFATRDENDYVTISPDNAEEFEEKLDKFTNDCRRLMHITANRFFGVREVLSEMGTAFAVSKKPVGDMLAQFIESMGEDALFNEAMIESVYETLNSIASEKIPINVNPESVYAENVGSLTFMFEYQFDYKEEDMVWNMVRLLHFLMTKKTIEDGYNPSLLNTQSKFYNVITDVHDNRGQFLTFADVNELIERYIRRNVKNEPFRVYFKNALFLLFIIITVGGAVAYGVFLLANYILG